MGVAWGRGYTDCRWTEALRPPSWTRLARHDKSFEDLSDLLTKHYDPAPIVIAERFYFYRCNQKSGESIADYLACLQRKASRCKFGNFLSEALRDRLVCGMASENTQKVLLTKANLTLEQAVEISQGMEAVMRAERRCFRWTHLDLPDLPVDVDVGTTTPRNVDSKLLPATSVARCDILHQLVALVQPAKGKLVSATSVHGLSRGNLVCYSRSIYATLSSKPLTMEVDTGAAVSLAPESAVSSLLGTTSLSSSCYSQNLHGRTDPCERFTHCRCEVQRTGVRRFKATSRLRSRSLSDWT